MFCGTAVERSYRICLGCHWAQRVRRQALENSPASTPFSAASPMQLSLQTAGAPRATGLPTGSGPRTYFPAQQNMKPGSTGLITTPAMPIFETPAVVVRGSWCPQCRHERSQSRHMQRLHELAAQRGGLCLSEGYLGADTALAWRCGKGHLWQMAPRHMIGRGWWCPFCSGRRKYTLADMRALAHARGGECVSETFGSSHDRLRWRCDRGHEWSTKAWHVISGRWCPSCARLDRIQAKNGWKRRRYEAHGKLTDLHMRSG